MGRINNADPGVITAGIDLYAQSATPYYDVGTRLAAGDGRVFHYCKAAGTLAAGKLTIALGQTANHHNMAVATTTAGSDKVTVTLGATAATADQYKDGLLLIIAGTGIGQTYKIKSHPAADASATLELTLYDELVVATDSTDSKGDLIPNIFGGTTQSAVEEHVHIGVPLIAVTDAYYHWEQTWGPVSCLGGDTAGDGTLLDASSAAGEVKTQNEYTMDLVGVAYGEAAADGEYNATILRLWP